MSKQNKVNKDSYTQAGRLTPDELARERHKQADLSSRAKDKARVTVRAPDVTEGPAPQRTKKQSEDGGPGSSRPRTGSGE